MANVGSIERLQNALITWSKGRSVKGIRRPKTMTQFLDLEWAYHTLLHYGEARTVCADLVPYYEFFGFSVKTEGIGWRILSYTEEV